MTTTETAETVAFDPAQRFVVTFLLDGSPLAPLVDVTTRPALTGTGQVTEVTAKHPTSSWSSGEQALWTFLQAVAGQGCVDLRHLAGYYRDSEISSRLVATFVSMMTSDFTVSRER